MLSKQERLKYGEQLRRQMKQRQEKKHVQTLQKRGLKKSPTDIRIPIEPQPYTDNKQVLQNRFQTQNVDYYGRPGGGAPNRQNTQQNNQNFPAQQNPYQPMQMGRQKTNQYPPYGSQQGLLNQNSNNLQQQRFLQNQYENVQRGNIDAQYYNNQAPPNYQNFQQNYPPQNYNNSYAPPSYNQNLGMNPQQAGIVQRVPTDRSFVDQQYQQQIPQGYPSYPNQRQYQQQAVSPVEMYQQPIQQINQKHQAFRQKTMENQELMEIHKKGGRNLLQLENMTIDQQQMKVKKQQQMRKFLELQIKQAQQDKKKQQERIKRQQLEEYRKNQQYLQLQKRRFQQQQKKKADKQRQLIQQNARNLQERKRLEQQAKLKAQRQKMKNSIPNNASINNSPRVKEKQVFSRQAQIQLPNQETTSEMSSSTVMDRGFNTGVSKQFFQNQRKKDQEKYNREKNLEAVTQQIRRLKQHIDKQNDFFKKQIQKVKLESEMAENQKIKAQQQIQSLKVQLKKKMQDDNQRLFLALQRQQSLVSQKQQNEYEPPRRNQRRPPPAQDYSQNIRTLKPAKDEVLVKKQYVPPAAPMSPKKQKYNQNFGESNVSDNGMLVSLRGQSKKIPINLPDQKLSMSSLSDFARQTQFFKNQGKSPYLPKKTNLRVQQSIVEEQEERGQSRAAGKRPNYKNQNNQRDELDKLVQRQKSRGGNWGQLSSVNSDITKQIQQLLKKKDNPYRPPSSTKYDNNHYNNPYNPLISNASNQRPSSHLSNAGRRALSRNGIQYDGASLGTLNSNVGGTNTLGTVDIDRIHNRNEKRLSQLRNMGVETINTNNGDQQFSKLDMILQNYKQKSRVG